MQNNLSQQLFGGKAILITKEIADYRHALYPKERELIIGTSEKRELEFSTGRFCAHQALHHFNVDNFPVTRGNQRDPVWPLRIVGSISHCRDLAGAVVADKQQIKSIGLDIENRKQLNPNIARHVCTEDEKRWLQAQAADQQNLALLLIFSLKEAVFKCIYQATQQHLRFQQCHVVPTLIDGAADLKIRLPGLMLQPDELAIHFCVTDTHVYSGATWFYLPAVG